MFNVRRKQVSIPICMIFILLIFSYSSDHGNTENSIREKHQLLENNESSQKLNSSYMEEEESEVENNLSIVAVVGVKKCGTGALIEVLRMHPGIVAPPYDQTEVEWNVLTKEFVKHRIFMFFI